MTHGDAMVLLDVIPDGLIVVDGHWRCRFANAALATFLRRGRDEVLGRSLWEVLGTPPGTDFTTRLERAAAERREDVIEWTGPDGGAVPVYVLPGAESVSLLLRLDSALRRTSRALDARLEARLVHAQKLETVGRLAGGVAHDFNNLLTVIQNYCWFVAAELPVGTAAHADMGEVLKATNSAADLTRQLLAFSRKQVLQPRRHDVKLTVLRIVGMLRRVLGEDIRIETELAPRVCSVLADPGQLEQVVMNLAVNARDAMPNGGTLRLGCNTVAVGAASSDFRRDLIPGTYVSIVVEDTGVGIHPDAVPQIFEPFYTTKGEGTGLGLAMVQGIVKQSGGEVHVESAPGHGSRFTVLLPWADENGAAAAATEAAAVAAAAAAAAMPLEIGSAETILVVEDEPGVRAVIHRMLEQLGYSVREAATAAEALFIAATLPAPPDLVLTDMIMPERSGRALAQELGERWPGVKVLFMSGYTDDDIRRRGLLDSGMVFLEKPFTIERVAHAVRESLDGTPGA